VKRPPRPARAVLLDFDGVVAATIEDNARAWQEAFAAHGAEIAAREYLRLEGMGPLRIAETLCDAHALPRSLAAAIVEAKEATYRRANSFRFYPGIPELIERLAAAGVRVALVTGSSAERFRRSVPADLVKHLASVTTAETAVKTKPDPAPYLDAIERCGIRADECVAVENAPLGIRSAIAAGVWCIAVASTVDAEDLAEADEIVASHELLIPRLVEICAVETAHPRRADR